jgi:hypothetical protein
MTFTPNVSAIMLLLLSEPEREWYGTELSVRAGCHRSTAMRILRHLGWAGWASDRASIGEAPVRYYHRLTETGIGEVRRTLIGQYGTGPAIGLLARAVGLTLNAAELGGES